MNYTDLWPLLQADILGVLAADEFIGARAGVLVEPGDIESDINTKLAKVIGAGFDGKTGVGFLVLPVERAEDDNPSDPFGPLKVTLTIQFCENPIINNSQAGTRLPVRIYAARAAKILKLYTPVGFTNSLVAGKPVISEFTDQANKKTRISQVEFTATEADAAPLRRLNRPQITVAGGAYPYDLAVVAPGSDRIFYTLDGSHPYERNAKARLYDGPVTITEPCLFRTRAFSHDAQQIASDTAAYSFA